ncbi:unnamed protein product [Calicophoron daubneyi]|uniref:Tafazzin family protein n=1 Tax=Calicophoron daubneyi TaxID=300641 RepID=A0AAV2TWK3_CALDB
MDLVYRLNKHSKVATILRGVFQPITYPLIGGLVKLAVLRHHLAIVNHDEFINAWKNRPRSRPLLTVSNHYSCLDDLLFGSLLSLFDLTRVDRYRWSLAAVDICFTNTLYSMFFNWGKCVPVWRKVCDPNTGEVIHPGGGVYQPSMNFSIELLNRGEWVHVFPQGRVIQPYERCVMAKKPLRWGIGRLIAECTVDPLVLPIWHCGFDTLNPSVKPTVRQTLSCILGKPRCLTIVIGAPIDFSRLRRELSANWFAYQSSAEFRSSVHARLTAFVQHSLCSLKTLAERLHDQSIQMHISKQ